MAQSVGSYYVAPIALTENLIEGATVSGTINGVQVSGTAEAGYVDLYAIAQVLPYQSSGGSLKVAEIDGDAGNYQIILGKQPESDLTIHLTQTVPAHKVIIPEEYLELTETNQAISAAMSAASTAQSAASSAQTAANAAKTTANTAKTTAETAKTTAEATAERYKDTQAKIGDTTIRRSYILLDIGSEIRSSPAQIVLHSDRGGAPQISTTIKAQSVTAVRRDRPAQLNLTGETVYAGDKSSLDTVEVTGLSSVIIASATSGSTKKFRITVDDTGAIKATEVTE